MAAGVALTGASFAAWLGGKIALTGGAVRLVPPALGAIAIACGLSIAAVGTGPSALKAEPFTQARLGELNAQGRPVFVNLTAVWCITCKANELIALRSSEVAQAFQAGGIVYLKGDWTKPNPEIKALLAQFGRAGVPLYVFYPGHGAEPRLLPQLLTPGIVLDEIKTQAAVLNTPAKKGA